MPIFAIFLLISALGFSPQVQALDFDWHGQFQTETNWLFGYSHGKVDPDLTNDEGYFIPYNGSSPASFQNLFLSLKPRVIVNDNISIHSDFWVGTRDNGFFGSSGSLASNAQNTRSNLASIQANLFYAQLATDFGTFQAGRAPLHWGLGLIWNHSNQIMSRLPSTGDLLKLDVKLGAFKFTPAVIKYSNGTNLGGTLASTPSSTVAGWSGAADYSLGISYENMDDQLDAGLLFLRRLAGQNSAFVNPMSVNTSGFSGYSFNIWDFYAKKKAGIFTLAAEVPLMSGQVGGAKASSLGLAAKVDAQVSESWLISFQGGQAQGQEGGTAGASASQYSAFYFHPDYRPGLILFNYNRRNFSNPGAGASSPYYDPVTNARFFSLSGTYSTGKWTHTGTLVYASALEVASGKSGDTYYNQWDGIFHTMNGGAKQDSVLGFEVDYGLGYQWDSALRLGLNTGLLVPGKFYAFNNSGTTNAQKTVFATQMSIQVNF